jgi:hypothetical protein
LTRRLQRDADDLNTPSEPEGDPMSKEIGQNEAKAGNGNELILTCSS